MKLSLLLILFTLGLCAAQAVPSVNPQCQANCTTSGCCNCCVNNSTCEGNAISSRCCPANADFCGCRSNRASCSGYIYNQTGSVSGSDTFGTCFNGSSGATCSYLPSPNFWIVCPAKYSACESASFLSCCDPDSVCTSTQADSTPICTPKNTPSNTLCMKADYCASGLCACNGACYTEDQYCCPNGQLTQKAFCPSTTGTTAVASTSSPATTSSTCQSASYCAPSLCACNGACYSEDQYCCPNGQLTQKAFCPSTTAATNSMVSVTSPLPSSTNTANNNGSSITLINNCAMAIDLCSAYNGPLFSLGAKQNASNLPSGPYNECSSVQAEVTLDGYDGITFFDLSEVAFKQNKDSISVYTSPSSRRITCVTSPCADATQPGQAPQVYSARGPVTVFIQWC